MALSTYGTGNLNPQNLYATKEFLDRIGPKLIIDMFAKMKKCPMNSTDTVLFPRSVVPDSDLTPSPEGITKASRQFVVENVQVTLEEFEESYAFSSKELETGEFGKFLMQEAKGNLNDLIMQTREEYAWSKFITGDNVLFNSDAVTSRGAVNGPLTLGRLDRALRLLEVNRSPYIHEAATGAMQQGTVPMPQAYVIPAQVNHLITTLTRSVQQQLEEKERQTMKRTVQVMAPSDDESVNSDQSDAEEFATPTTKEPLNLLCEKPKLYCNSV